MDTNKKIDIIKYIIDLLNKSNGRDKLYRVFQYFFKFMSYQISQKLIISKNESNENKLKIYKSISGNMGMARKLFRFGKHFGLHKSNLNLINLLLNKKTAEKNSIQSNKLYLIFKLLSEINLSLYFYADHILFFNKIELVTNKNIVSKCDVLSNIFWLLDSINSLIANLLELNHNSFTFNKFDKNKKIEIEKRNLAIKTDILRLVFDIPVCIGFVFKGTLKDDIIGILGTISSLVGVYQNLG